MAKAENCVNFDEREFDLSILWFGSEFSVNTGLTQQRSTFVSQRHYNVTRQRPREQWRDGNRLQTGSSCGGTD